MGHAIWFLSHKERRRGEYLVFSVNETAKPHRSRTEWCGDNERDCGSRPFWSPQRIHPQGGRDHHQKVNVPLPQAPQAQPPRTRCPVASEDPSDHTGLLPRQCSPSGRSQRTNEQVNKRQEEGGKGVEEHGGRPVYQPAFSFTQMPASFQHLLPLPGSFTLQRARALVLEQQGRLAPAKTTELSGRPAGHPWTHPLGVLLRNGGAGGALGRSRVPARPCQECFKRL